MMAMHPPNAHSTWIRLDIQIEMPILFAEMRFPVRWFYQTIYLWISSIEGIPIYGQSIRYCAEHDPSQFIYSMTMTN